jgi:hypothetical protein
MAGCAVFCLYDTCHIHAGKNQRIVACRNVKVISQPIDDRAEGRTFLVSKFRFRSHGPLLMILFVSDHNV